MQDAEPTSHKHSLSIEQQIDHLKDKGVTFNSISEDEAAEYLERKCNLFKVASYRKLFSKHLDGDKAGQYITLDFAQLRLLSSIDQQLRTTLLTMSLDIEHFHKIAILDKAERQEEDGYAIVADYMSSLSPSNRSYRLSELKASGHSLYSEKIYDKYRGRMPMWVFLELTSFGTLIDFTRFCAERWNDKLLLDAHYDLKGVKSIRNCAAHGSCMLNALTERSNKRRRVTNSILRASSAAKVSKATRSKWMCRSLIQQIATVLVIYSRTVPEGRSRDLAKRRLSNLFGRIEEKSALLPASGPDSSVRAAFDFLQSLTLGLGLLE